MGVAGQWHAAAAGEPAVPVAEGEGFPDAGGDEALGAADVEDLAVVAEDGGDDLGVAGEPSYRSDRDGVAGVQRGGTGAGAERIEADGDGEAGFGAVLVRQQPVGFLGFQGELDEGVLAAGAVVAQIPR